MDSFCYIWFITINLSYKFPIFEPSTTALCGTIDKINLMLYNIFLNN